jgi:heme oxygenase
VAFTYDPSEPTDLDRVRGIIGDTVTGESETDQQYLADETIQSILTTEGSVIRAAIECVSRILAKLARETDRSAHGLSSSRSQRSTHYRDLLADLRRRSLETTSGGITVIGSSAAANAALAASVDFPSRPFSIGRDDHGHA